jgi:hypothetical protein
MLNFNALVREIQNSLNKIEKNVYILSRFDIFLVFVIPLTVGSEDTNNGNARAVKTIL